jgi:endonuclease/exonuclease/phosphatase family metal-dependent hydrolase
MKILTCNVRCFGAEDGENGWSHRKDLCAKVIESQSPDIICFQEMWAEQFTHMAAAFSSYGTYGIADMPNSSDPQNCIFYREDIYTLISAGGYWLSKTPHVPGSRSWESACVRLANWIRLQDRATKREFRVINTHLDHVNQVARENQAQLIVEDASAYPPDYPQILTGDMNCDTTNAAISVFKVGGWRDTYGSVHGTENPGHTYHAFLGPAHETRIGKMDWILMRGDISCPHAGIVTDSVNGRFPSDHYFVSAEVSMGEQAPADDILKAAPEE